jgi:small subunit ribosomal protein S6e
MAFKINISDKGKTLKIETESESLIRKKIGEKINGESFSPELEGYELEITGTSDAGGFPGIKGNQGTHLRKILLKKGEKGIRDRRKGIRLKKSIRGEEIGEKITQINMKVIKQGKKKFEELLPKKEKTEEKPAEGQEQEKPAESAKPAEERSVEEQEGEKPEEEPKPVKEETKEASQPEQEPKTDKGQEKELANPDQEPK